LKEESDIKKPAKFKIAGFFIVLSSKQCL